MSRKAIVLSSGGLDSTTTLAIAKEAGYEVLSLSFDYGQRHFAELDAAKRVALAMGIEHRVFGIDLRQVGGSALTSDIAVPKDRDEKTMSDGIPVTYVPARNTVLLSYALGLADVIGCDTIFIGVNALDYSGYPDCRPEYIEAFQALANLALKSTTQEGPDRKFLKIEAPLIHLTKREIILLGARLGVDFSLTHSCYDPSPTGRACGHCDSCIIRHAGFVSAGIDDPTAYENEPAEPAS